MKFMALGGVDVVGASCYYLELCGKKFLLDCGRRVEGTKTFAPERDALIKYNCVFALSYLDAIFLSHGHYDHLGALQLIESECSLTPIFATRLTKQLSNQLLMDKYLCRYDGYARIARELENEAAIGKIREVKCYSPMSFEGIRITFFEAGHVPGAAMIYFESAEGNVLYSGDFMPHATKLTPGYQLPDNIKADTLILCGTHSKHPKHHARKSLDRVISDISWMMKENDRVYVSVKQLTKGVEVLCGLRERLPNVPIYSDATVFSMANQLACAGVDIPQGYFASVPGDFRNPGIYIGAHSRNVKIREYDADFTLHAEYSDCVELIRRSRAKTVFVVHAPPDSEGLYNRALQNEFPDKEIVYPTLAHIYDNIRVT